VTSRRACWSIVTATVVPAPAVDDQRAQRSDPLPKPHQTEVARFGAGPLLQIKTAPVIAHRERQTTLIETETHVDLAGPAVDERVVHCLVNDAEKFPAYMAREHADVAVDADADRDVLSGAHARRQVGQGLDEIGRFTARVTQIPNEAPGVFDVGDHHLLDHLDLVGDGGRSGPLDVAGEPFTQGPQVHDGGGHPLQKRIV
jgi:hypothetical protein